MKTIDRSGNRFNKNVDRVDMDQLMESWFDDLYEEKEEVVKLRTPDKIGEWVASAINALDRCNVIDLPEETKNGKTNSTRSRVLEWRVTAIIRQWPFQTAVDEDGRTYLDPQNAFEKDCFDRLQRAYEDNLERLSEERNSIMMKWNSGEREAGFAELCTSNSGISEYSRKMQEYDAFLARSQDGLLKAYEQKTPYLGKDKERYWAWHKALKLLVRAIRNTKSKNPKVRARAWDLLKLCRDRWSDAMKDFVRKDRDKDSEFYGEVISYHFAQKKWSYSPKAVLMLYSKRIQSLAKLMWFHGDLYVSLCEKVSRIFRALGTKSQKVTLKRDPVKIAAQAQRDEWDSSNYENLGDQMHWIKDEALTPEELLSLAQEGEEF